MDDMDTLYRINDLLTPLAAEVGADDDALNEAVHAAALALGITAYPPSRREQAAALLTDTDIDGILNGAAAEGMFGR